MITNIMRTKVGHNIRLSEVWGGVGVGEVEVYDIIRKK